MASHNKTTHATSTDTNTTSSRLSRRQLLQQGAMLGAVATVTAGVALAHPGPAHAGTVDFFNVKAYGATGDGSTDDTASVQSAINAALASNVGGTVYFPSGFYRITNTLSFGSQKRVEVVGNGFSSTVLWAFDGDLFRWEAGVLCSQVTMRDFRIQPATSLSPASAAIACQGGVVQSLFQNLLVIPPDGVSPVMGSGIRMVGFTDSTTIINCSFWRVTGTGIELGSGSEVRITGGRIIGVSRLQSGSSEIGIHMTGNNGGVHIDSVDVIDLYEGCRIANSSGAGSNREVFITHSTFDGCFQGLSILDSTFVSIAGCWAASCDHENIYVGFGSPTLVISGGTIYNAGVFDSSDPLGRNGMTVNSGVFQVSGVDIRGNRGKGVWVPNPNVTQYSITGCRIRDNQTGADLTGNTYICTNNIFAGNSSANAFGGSNYVVNNNIG